MKNEFHCVGVSLNEAQKRIGEFIERMHSPVLIRQVYQAGGLDYLIKYEGTDSNGNSVSDELHKGSIRIVPTQNPDGIRIIFNRGEFPSDDLFSKTREQIKRVLRIKSNSGKIGRPSIEAYDWAYKEELSGRPRTEVFREWIIKYEIECGEVDRYTKTSEMYKAAMKYRKQKGRKR